MTCKEIDTKLRNKFKTHKYELSNSYIYNWESDFFSITNSGYAQEIEVKLTYSDFKADFSKISKHNLLSSVYNNKDVYTDFKGFIYASTKSHINRFGEKEISKNTTLQPNRGYETWCKKRGHKFEMEFSVVEYRDVTICPNKLYYICPKGTIPLEEVPEYAGLYYITENGRIYEQKKAPFIHKEKHNLDKILLDKFYYKQKYGNI